MKQDFFSALNKNPFLSFENSKEPFQKPLIMGILNTTPDSFSDGGKFLDPEKAVGRALQMVDQGADIIDIGGESSGPNSKDVSLQDELERVLPVVKMLRQKSEVLISVDTYKAEVARQVIEAGVDLINDVTALRGDSLMASTLAKYAVPVIVMYSKDPTARTSRLNVDYGDVLQTVEDFLEQQIKYGIEQGILRDRFIIDPGMGAFVSMDPKYSLQILNHLRRLKKMELPILVGVSRKGFIGQTLDAKVEERLEGSLACAAVAIMNGASILRVHDVQETRRFVDMLEAIWNQT